MSRAEQFRAAIEEAGSIRAAGRALGVPEATIRRTLDSRKQQQTDDRLDVALVPDVDDIEDLLEQRKRAFLRRVKHEEASKLLDVKVKVDGPIGIMHFGDPHVDDDGADILALERHTQLVNETPGLFGANVGDTTNNWTGRLAHLYSEQSTTAKQAWMLAEWFVKRCKWLYMIGGNHDGWSGAGDPLQWIARGQTHIHKPSEARINLRFPNGRCVLVNARHDFAGGSQWNPAHGPMKAVQLGDRDHISICGHKHKSGYGILRDPATGRACHAIQVGSYKVYDRYAKEKGFRDQQLSPCVMTIIDPRLEEANPNLVQVFWDPEEGADYLKWKRGR